MMGIFDRYFTLGLGTSRLPISGPTDIAGIEKSIALVSNAIDAGIDYIDTAYTYSAGMAQAVLKEALKNKKQQVGVTIKVMLDMDKTADEARSRAEFQLESMGITKAAFFVCWTVLSYSEFQDITRKGGIYDAALKMKNEGLVDHVCCSLHTSQEDSIKIIKSGAFEGITISFSLLNAIQMLPVLDAAKQNAVDVAVMNPLGGGIIPNNAEFFSFAQGTKENTNTAALRFVRAHPAVKIVLSGLSRENELNENIHALIGSSPESDINRLERVLREIRSIKGFCVNCHYCDGCPADIPISEIMNKRNKLLFGMEETYNRSDPELTSNIQLFQRHFSSHSVASSAEWFPDSPDNPCIRCGKCEEKCTQRLEIINAIDDTYVRADKAGFSRKARRERLEELLVGKQYQLVGLYPNGGFSNMIVSFYQEFFGNPEFKWIQFNSDPKMWGQVTGGLPIHSPNDIEKLKPDIIVICTYKYDKEIYDNLKQFEDKGIQIVKLHREYDVPWVF